MIVIFGSGFGLYGYLPALVAGCGERIVLPARVRTRFAQRPELQRFADSIFWAEKEDDALAAATGAVLALPPDLQAARARQCLARPNIGWLLLEKPLAPNPDAAHSLLADLRHAGTPFRIGYLFRHVDWGRRLLAHQPEGPQAAPIRIRWRFMAHHFRNNVENWKRDPRQGGGALRFFGVHLIALLAELGYRRVNASFACGDAPGRIDAWEAEFSGPALPPCSVAVDSRSAVETFAVVASPAASADLKTPFETCLPLPELPGVDTRAPLLAAIRRSLDDGQDYGWYGHANALWEQAETTMRCCVRAGGGRESMIASG